ncbi:hypothetical protein K440DRAFT_509363, partial [Wilcoxina mikolae CBS 423.85]
INEFFAKYPYFPYERTAPFWGEYYRLCRFSPRKKHEAAWAAFRIAVVEDFGPMFGREKNDPVAWGKLCKTVGISPIPESLDDRRKKIMRAHVNLVDMHECARMGKFLKTPTTENLKAYIMMYTICTTKFYPREDAYAVPLLEYLLREI